MRFPAKTVAARLLRPGHFALLADALTASRLIVAGVILLLGFVVGQTALGIVFLLTLFAWTTDLLDGTVARWSGPQPHTRLARWDLWIDIALVVATLTFTIVIRLLHPVLALAYPVGLAVMYFAFHSPARLREVNTMAHAVTFGAIVVGAPSLVAPLLAWLGAMLVAFRRRAAQEMRAAVRRYSPKREA